MQQIDEGAGPHGAHPLKRLSRIRRYIVSNDRPFPLCEWQFEVDPIVTIREIVPGYGQSEAGRKCLRPMRRISTTRAAYTTFRSSTQYLLDNRM